MTESPGPILQLLVSTKPGGGPAHVELLARGLRALGWDPIVAGPADGALFDGFVKMGIETAELATNRLRPTTLASLVRLVRRRGVRLIHSHGKGAGLYGRVGARLTGVPAVHTFHGIHFERYAPPVRAAYLALERRLSAWTACVVNVSRAEEREGLALRLFDAGSSRVIPNGVDVARLGATALGRAEARAVLKLPPDATVVGAVARFDEVKRLDVLIDAVARVPGLTLVLIGDGATSGRLRGRVAGRGLGPRVVFAGEVEGAARLLRAFDIYASASRKEGMPLAVLEAMALGLPVVASDIPSHREVLGPASGGLVTGTVGAFAEELERLGRDAGARGALGAENRERARREFDAREMVAALEALYGEVLRL
jgi:glycosyltransferase involved in cell wall biosynthesis